MRRRIAPRLRADAPVAGSIAKGRTKIRNLAGCYHAAPVGVSDLLSNAARLRASECRMRPTSAWSRSRSADARRAPGLIFIAPGDGEAIASASGVRPDAMSSRSSRGYLSTSSPGARGRISRKFWRMKRCVSKTSEGRGALAEPTAVTKIEKATNSMTKATAMSDEQPNGWFVNCGRTRYFDVHTRSRELQVRAGRARARYQ